MRYVSWSYNSPVRSVCILNFHRTRLPSLSGGEQKRQHGSYEIRCLHHSGGGLPKHTSVSPFLYVASLQTAGILPQVLRLRCASLRISAGGSRFHPIARNARWGPRLRSRRQCASSSGRKPASQPKPGLRNRQPAVYTFCGSNLTSGTRAPPGRSMAG